MHDGKAEPWRVTPPEAVAYLFELEPESSDRRVGSRGGGEDQVRGPSGALSARHVSPPEGPAWAPGFVVIDPSEAFC